MKRISWVGLVGAVLTIAEFIYESIKAEKDKEEMKAEILEELRSESAANKVEKESA